MRERERERERENERGGSMKLKEEMRERRGTLKCVSQDLHSSKFHFSPSFLSSISCSPLSHSLSLSFPPLKHPLQASYPRHILGGEAHSSLSYSLVDGASSLLFSFAIRCISMVENRHGRTSLKFKDPASIEAPQASFHQIP